APPFFVIHGDSDSLAPLDGARRFVEALRKTSRSAVAFAVLPGAQHGFEVFASARALHAINGVERFLAWAHGLYLEAKKE
ncbi:MAG: prolyl oligopeptidase family serine peptidase, partial [Myxococcales bacterium]|nr:prolyl oligopeptidase family serine peptidase [Myxococcales bacterium]